MGSVWTFRFWACGTHPAFIKTMQRLFIEAVLFAKFSGLQSDQCSTLQKKIKEHLCGGKCIIIKAENAM